MLDDGWFGNARMNRHVTFILTVLLLVGVAVAKYTSKSKAPTDLCKGAIDPYRPGIQKSRFFRAAGADNELTESEFNADRSRPKGFARRFDSWRAMLLFDKDRNKSIDWIEADAYRYDLRRRALAAYDSNSDGKLSGDERVKANKDLARGRIALPPKSKRIVSSTGSRRYGRSDRGDADKTERDRLKDQLEAIRKRLYSSPQLAGLQRACAAAERAYENAKKGAVVAEAHKPYDAAREIYEKARDKTPEARIYERAKKAYYDAYHSMPEYKAYSQAKEALGRVDSKSDRYAGARAAYERAKGSYEAMKTGITEYRIYKEAREARDAAAHSLGEYKDVEDAEKAYRRVYEKHLTRERKARDDANKARDEKLNQLLKADPAARGIYKRIKKIDSGGK